MTGVTVHTLPPLPLGCLASPHPFLGATHLAVEVRVVLASSVFFLVLFVEGDVVSSVCCRGKSGDGEFWSPVRGCDMGRDWILQVAVWRMGASERRLLIMQLKFQQSSVEFLKLPQLQLIGRVVVISVA